MPVTNRSSYTDVDFFPIVKMKVVGKIGVKQLILVGTEQGTGAMVVASTTEKNLRKADLHAVPIYELMNHTQEAIELF